MFRVGKNRLDNRSGKVVKKSDDKKRGKKNNNKEFKYIWKNIFTKTNITYFFILLCDIILVIFCARKNRAQYVNVFDRSIFIGQTRNILFGRNYVNVIITIFFYFYIVIMNRFFLKRKNTKMFLIFSFLFLFILNILLFYLFTVKVY